MQLSSEHIRDLLLNRLSISTLGLIRLCDVIPRDGVNIAHLSFENI